MSTKYLVLNGEKVPVRVTAIGDHGISWVSEDGTMSGMNCPLAIEGEDGKAADALTALRDTEAAEADALWEKLKKSRIADKHLSEIMARGGEKEE